MDRVEVMEGTPSEEFYLEANVPLEMGKDLKTLMQAYTSDAALQLVRSVDKEHGLEMYRVVYQYYDPTSHGRQVSEAHAIFHPETAKSLAEVPALLTRWENAVQREEARRGLLKLLPEDYRLSIILSMLPNDERNEMEAQKHMFKTYR